ncbi:MAG TPA: TetR/AcrR family transcriptional regulator [Methanoregula sp.]|nr:TetR/AcrR family transcriptional regulator [Methanoregula sp.]
MPRINPGYHDHAKKKIIDATLEIAKDGGWNTVTLETVARKVGVTKGALYTYFENSDALMDEVAFELAKRFRDRFHTDRSEKIVGIHELLEDIAEFVFSDKEAVAPLFMQALERAVQDAKFRDHMAEKYDDSILQFREVFIKAQKSGQIPEEVNITMAVQAIYGLTLGLAFIYQMLEKDQSEAKQLWIGSVERILHIHNHKIEGSNLFTPQPKPQIF